MLWKPGNPGSDQIWSVLSLSYLEIGHGMSGKWKRLKHVEWVWSCPCVEWKKYIYLYEQIQST